MSVDSLEPLPDVTLDKPRGKFVFYYMSLVPCLWGTTYVVTKTLIQDYPVFYVTGLRHFLAFLGLLIFLPFLKIDKKAFNMRNLKYGLITGISNFFAVVTQTYGLLVITAGIGGFISSLYVLIVPILSWIFYKRKINKAILYSLVISLIGLVILLMGSNSEGGSENRMGKEEYLGVFLIFLCALFFALQMIYTEHAMRGEIDGDNNKDVNHPVDPSLLTFIQLLVIFVLSFILSPLIGEANPLFPNSSSSSSSPMTSITWILFIFLATLGTTLPFFLMNKGQSEISSTKAGLIFTTEPIWASFYGIIILHESVTCYLVLGGAIIFISLYITAKKQ